MLTYQLQRRVFRIADGAAWEFPNDVEIEFWFEPQEPFGTRHGYSRTVLRGVKATMLYNANNGFCSARSERPLDPVDVCVQYDNATHLIRGNKLYVRGRCETAEELNNVIYSIHGLIPPMLNVFLLDSPFITVVQGKVGETAFRWEFAETRFELETTSNDRQEEVLLKALSLHGSGLGADSHRLRAALGYFYKACRLIAAGNGPWEFMSETILNLTKSLEILFDVPSNETSQGEGGSRDRIRNGLKCVGVEANLIEEIFIPITILRNEFDVGHGRLALNSIDDLQLIYGLLAKAETEFRRLLRQIVTGVSEGLFTLQPYTLKVEATYSGPMQGVIEALRAKAVGVKN